MSIKARSLLTHIYHFLKVILHSPPRLRSQINFIVHIFTSQDNRHKMSYNVYKAKYWVNPTRNHHTIFIEVPGSDYGVIIQVYGEVQQGMKYDIQKEVKPENGTNYLGKELVGKLPGARLMKFLEVCESVPPPYKQLDDMCVKIYPERPFYRSAEWIEDVIRKLKERGCLEPPDSDYLSSDDLGSGDSSSSSSESTLRNSSPVERDSVNFGLNQNNQGAER